MPQRSTYLYRLLIAGMVWLVGGCASKSAVGPTTIPGGQRIAVLAATCYPPPGWHADPLKISPKHHHQVWVSPTGSTAYGVIHFTLPLPVSADVALWGFLREMKRTEGSSELIYKQAVPSESAVRFEAQGGLYRVRGFLRVSGWEGWAAYAGTKADHSILMDELETAEQARDKTLFHPD